MNFCSGFVLALTVCWGMAAAEEDNHFVNSWATMIQGGEQVAREVAEQHGYRFVRSVMGLDDHYLLERSDIPHRSRRSADHHTRKLSEDDRVTFVEQQQLKTRVKRDFIDRDTAARDGRLDDPQFPREWYLNQGDPNTNRRDGTKFDLRVMDAWKIGITGKGVTVCIIDDGIEHTHPDLQQNYEPKGSYDINDNDDDPSPRYDPTNENKHGTRCAGEIAMVANNNYCGVGLAYDAKVSGIRLLDGKITDSSEAESLSYAPEINQVYSSSWGPNDDGRTLDGPSSMTTKALEQGVAKGRKGLGSIYMVASGNGGRSGDNCNADGYTSAIQTISVSSASQYGKAPFYAERCASTLTTAFSSGSVSEGKVISADLHNKCTDGHTGTSAAAPMAAAIVALILEANPNLTWRDVQHIFVHTSRRGPLDQDRNWYTNAAGYCVNQYFGFGLIDALAAVELADPKSFKSVGPQHICVVEALKTDQFPIDFVSGDYVSVVFNTDGCKGQENEINFLEHIQVVVNIDHENRGAVYAEVESPSHTNTTLMYERPYDTSRKGFVNWAWTSVHSWGESPSGQWIVRIADRSKKHYRGSVKSVKLILYGTKEMPPYRKTSPPQCAEIYKAAESPNEDSTQKPDMKKLEAWLSVNSSISDEKLKYFMSLLDEYHKSGEHRELPIKDDSDIDSLIEHLFNLKA